MFKNIVVVGICLVFSGCAALGQWKGARDYRKSQIQGKRILVGYGYHYMLGWNLEKAIHDLDVSIAKLKATTEKWDTERAERKKRMESMDTDVDTFLKEMGIK